MPYESLIHPTAIISSGAKVHETAKVDPYAVIGPNVEIGAGTRIGSHAIIDGYTKIGENCRIFPGASIGLEPQDLSYKDEPTGVIIGNRVQIREYVTIHRGTGDRFTTIGDDCFFMNYSHIAHDCRFGNGVILANNATFAGHCQVGDNAVVAGSTVFHQHVRIGRMAMLSGLSGSRLDIPPYATCDGRPFRFRTVNLVGMRRQKFSAETRSAIKQAYILIYRSGMNNTQAIEKVIEKYEAVPEVMEIVEFFKSSKRGVAKGYDADSNDEDLEAE
ncbi:MAG: acyl-ACP--UDP-N-acetylglucosamine O-acyltransferase [Candidatus Melainabacteria bacterium]|nr:acyl-ACP--UDP-N-acetylglucosamine O-acyltransferase [Candidatus Melainabacteria bacterium]